ncbi:hypothetical protein D0Y65_047683 [Glycine soja]|uniref:CCHC-type domain-containing protein n=2 Tax=Glycine subgen. Soja TaxID=1462606 RepID=A0A445FPV9_GLYSO|nr:hypothetical protein D0Y65_047683 [Glycine soja]
MQLSLCQLRPPPPDRNFFTDDYDNDFFSGGDGGCFFSTSLLATTPTTTTTTVTPTTSLRRCHSSTSFIFPLPAYYVVTGFERVGLDRLVVWDDVADAGFAERDKYLYREDDVLEHHDREGVVSEDKVEDDTLEHCNREGVVGEDELEDDALKQYIKEGSVNGEEEVEDNVLRSNTHKLMKPLLACPVHNTPYDVINTYESYFRALEHKILCSSLPPPSFISFFLQALIHGLLWWVSEESSKEEDDLLLMSARKAISFSEFDGRCYGSQDKEIPPPPISKDDMERFLEVPISDEEFFDRCKPWKGSLMSFQLNLFNEKFLWRLGSTLGEMLKIDKVTTIQSRGKFARICVELDLDKPLQPKAIVREYLLNMQYEGLHVVCFKCGRYGHRERDCVHGAETGSSDMMVHEK